MSTIYVPQELRRGGLSGDLKEYVNSAVELIELLFRNFSIDDLSQTRLLDIGCGTKFTQAFLENSLPIGKYVGIDVSQEIIDFLNTMVDDQRLEYHHMNIHNAMYNPSGEPLLPDTVLPVAEQAFDIICLFSVFTHLEPHDFHTMLRVIRPYVKADGRLIFSVFVNERTRGGYGLMDGLGFDLDKNGLPDEEQINYVVPDFEDAGKDPLQWALYSRKYAFALIENTGWQVLSLNDPEKYIQHYFICRPV